MDNYIISFKSWDKNHRAQRNWVILLMYKLQFIKGYSDRKTATVLKNVYFNHTHKQTLMKYQTMLTQCGIN